MSRSLEGIHERILIVNTNPAFRDSLAEQLRSSGFTEVTDATGESASHLLRNSRRAFDWLYTRAELPGLIDGRILADEYHGSHPDRTAVVATSSERAFVQGHQVLKEPSSAVALDTIYSVATKPKPAVSADGDPQSLAA